MNGIRPCPYVGCRHHLYLDVSADGRAIKFNFPWIEPWDLPYSCALDLADTGELTGGMTLESVGSAMNLTRERLRQVENVALRRANLALRQFSPELDVQDVATVTMQRCLHGLLEWRGWNRGPWDRMDTVARHGAALPR